MRGTAKRRLSAFNAGDVNDMPDGRSGDVGDHVNEGQSRMGKSVFPAFCGHIWRCYREDLTNRVNLAGGR